TGFAWVMRLSSRRLARRAGRSGDSRARSSGQPLRERGMPQTGRCEARLRLPVDSGSGGEVLGEHLGGCPPRECLARSTVERRRDSCELVGAVAGEVGASGEILAQQPVGVLVGAAVPRDSWIAE